jgi:tetratricopeptide (TPR) repeat protein
MTEEKTYTISQAQLHFAIDFHGKTWEMLEKKDRTPDEDERMLDYAHASLAHWRTAGSEVRHQRGQWLLARVYAVLGEGKRALKHAQMCFDLLDGNKADMEDFDFAFAYEAIARAYAVTGDKGEAKRFIQMAHKAGDAIKEKEDRDIFFSELNGGDWYGVT